nr:hypothetical protein [Maliibacterium massiliense]
MKRLAALALICLLLGGLAGCAPGAPARTSTINGLAGHWQDGACSLCIDARGNARLTLTAPTQTGDATDTYDYTCAVADGQITLARVPEVTAYDVSYFNEVHPYNANLTAPDCTVALRQEDGRAFLALQAAGQEYMLQRGGDCPQVPRRMSRAQAEARAADYRAAIAQARADAQPFLARLPFAVQEVARDASAYNTYFELNAAVIYTGGGCTFALVHQDYWPGGMEANTCGVTFTPYTLTQGAYVLVAGEPLDARIEEAFLQG